jgi:twitching motility protein PilT
MKLLGELVVNMHLMTREQLADCLERQKSPSCSKPLGEIFLERGLIDADTLRTLLTVQEHLQAPVAKDHEAKGVRLHQLAPSASKYLKAARALGATTLHLSSGMRPLVRVNGSLVELPLDPVGLEECQRITLSILSEEQADRFKAQKSVEYSGDVPGVGRFRANVFQHHEGLAAVFKIIPDHVRALSTLGLPVLFEELAKLRRGLVVVAGPRRSGKSTTVASFVEHLNRNHKLRIAVLDDAVEFTFRSKLSLVSQRGGCGRGPRLAGAIETALRQDPDVVVLGEISDPDAAWAAIEAASGPRLVVATLPARSVCTTLLRLVDPFAPDQRAGVRSRLADVLRAVFCQELLPAAEGSATALAWEAVVVNRAVAHLLRENRIWQIAVLLDAGGGQGNRLMDDSLEDLVRQGRIRLETALARSTDKTRFAKYGRVEVHHA